ncbi:major facilitator superfamily transporter [Apiospora aurea]|uniref:Major facilitator superfamily transporter n=1 Tax=Apiospora aurea TaxID=335848 RepID=A0ABR1Q3J3_9PEZI
MLPEPNLGIELVNGVPVAKGRHDPETTTTSDADETRVSTQDRLSPETESVFLPLDNLRFSITDAIIPSQRTSWHESAGGLNSFSTQTPASPRRARSTRSDKAHSRWSRQSFRASSGGVGKGLPPEIAASTETMRESLVLPEPTPDLPTGFKLLMIVVALNISIFLIALDNTIVATAIPAITDEFHGIQDVAWYGAAFFMTAGGFQSTWGKMYKYFPLKPSYLAAIVIFEVGSLVCAVAPTSPSFIIGRAVAGVGAAGVGSGSYTIIAFVAEPKDRATYTGILGAVYGLASVLGPLLGGVFSSTTTWRWCFWINLPIGAVSIGVIVLFLRMPESAKPQVATMRERLLQMDPIGTTLLMGTVIAYLLAVHYGGQIYPWSNPTVIGLLVGTVLILAALALCEWWQGERAIFVPRLLRRRRILLPAAYAVVLPGAFFAMIYYMPIYFQAVRSSSAVISGVQNLPFIVSAMTGALAAGVFISRTGLATPLMVAGAGLGVLGCGLCATFDVDTATGRWVAFQLVAGLGLGGAFQVPIVIGQASATPEDLSSTTSMLLSFQTLGGALCVSAAQSAFVNTLIGSLPGLAPHVDPLQVVATGAGQLRGVFSAADLPGIVASYLQGMRVTYFFECALMGVALVAAVLSPWKRLDVNAVKENGGAT